MKINDLEKAVSAKYSLNIRQAKDAVESARQTIKSQRELVKMNYENYSHKVMKIEKILNDKDKKLSDKKRNALASKLDKRRRRMECFKGYMDTGTFPPVTFGTKKMFLKRCKGLITNKEWKYCRNSRIYSRGDKTKCGNPNLRVIIRNNMTFLEISTLEKTESNRAVKIQVPIYLPQKLSKKTGRVNGINYREMFLNHLQCGEAYQVELIREDDKYYAHITFELPKPIQNHTGYNGIIGVDTNPGGFALTMVDSQGNHKWHVYLKQHELVYTRGDRRENLCGELAKQVVLTAKAYNCGIAVEDMKFKDDTDVQSKFGRVKHQFIYSKLLSMLERAALREGIEIIKVKPQYTSKIGLYKYCHQYGMSVHNGAAMVIARRSFKLKEKVPKLLKDKLIKDIDGFNRKNEWSRWAVINKIINEKGVKSPGLWLGNRKQILGLAG
jgi:IS605 OrfB family transposase